MEIDFNKSIIEEYKWKGVSFLLKRDDLISPFINGNKAYKFYFLFKTNFKHLISCGGNQSNAMLALSYIAKQKGAIFTYFTKHLSKTLSFNLNGNIKLALANGMKLYFLDNLDILPKYHNKESIFIKQGGTSSLAKNGIIKLANSILKLNLDSLCVFYASGTGISSFYLQEILSPYGIDVFTTNCIGSKDYLLDQFKKFKEQSLHNTFPIILTSKEKLIFTKPNKKILDIYKEWLNIGVEFDLLYDCIMWHAIESNINLFNKYKYRLFIHSGGLSGNVTQLKRYQFVGMY